MTTTHRQPWANRMIFVSGRLSLDFAHTGGSGRFETAFERLCEPADLAAWLQQSDPRLPTMRIAQSDLEEARALRRAIWDAANAVRESRCPEASDISAINRFAAYLPPVPALDADGSRAVLTLPEGPRSALSVVARDAVDVLTRHSDMPIKQCENPACALLFVDTSRGKQRRWCSMGRCGNMKKVARHRAKSGAQGANVAAGGDVE